jgi:RimJ/RimL family protein N-acetyltransferase
VRRRPGRLTLRTPRLLLRPFAAGDAGALHRMWTGPEVRRYLFDGNRVAPGFVREQIAASRRLFRERGFGLYTIRLRGRTVGFAGLKRFGRPLRIELFYALRPSAWGRGYATEASLAVLRHGFERGLRVVWAGADPPNRASFGVMRRLGFRRARREVLGGVVVDYYRLRRRDFVRRLS